MKSPRCLHWCTKWALYLQSSVCAAQGGKGAFTTVGHRQFNAFMPGGPTCVGNGAGHFVGSGGAPKLVDCRQYSHGF
jgi:hypothetical protein